MPSTSCSSSQLPNSPTASPSNSLPPVGGIRGGLLPATTHPEALALQRQYPDSASLLASYNPDRATAVIGINDRRRIYCGRAPELNVVSKAYGSPTAISWIEIQLRHLSEYAGARDKITPAALHDLATIILAKYWYLRLSEFMLFIAEFKAGTYGKFYGAVDPMVIGEALRRFDVQRQQEMDRIERQDRQRALEAEREATAHRACSHREWQARKEIIGYILTGLLQKTIHE